jgi:phosphoenolpyruvate carboxykinase (ATP)
MFWFMMGYTSKLAGTETGVVEPQTTFSRFFGAPFMPGLPSVYAGLLGEKLRRHGSRVYLVNTGWTAGPYGQGSRMDLRLTRALVQAALDGTLDSLPLRLDPWFKVAVPEGVPGIENQSVLNPESTWADPAAFRDRAQRLAGQFAAHFQKAFPNRDRNLDQHCPGL